MESFLFGTSLIAAFFAGMVALFAPCCITFLLPAYLANVFKEKDKIILMTLVFGLGIFVVLLPAVLGVAFISQFLFHYHNTVYITGGIIMILVSFITLLGIKLPTPHFNRTQPQKADVLSIFTLGVVSGIASACCAPVLIGILTLTFLSPNFFGALGIGAMYVLGMVMPLLIISAFLSGKMPGVNMLRKSIADINILGRNYNVIASNLMASIIFFVTGWLTLFLTQSGKLNMDNNKDFTYKIQSAETFVNGYVGNNSVLNIVFAALIILTVYIIINKNKT